MEWRNHNDNGEHLYICVLLLGQYLYLVYFNNVKEKENTLVKNNLFRFDYR